MGTRLCTNQHRPLNDYILHHEDLDYDAVKLQQQHVRSKRSADNEPVSLTFTAFGRYFHLQLRKDNEIFSKDHKQQLGDVIEENVDTSFIYKGVEKYTPRSKVQGSIINGIFRGSVDIPGDTIYQIEASDKYKKGAKSPCIIYREKDMNLDPYRNNREASAPHGTCALGRERVWMLSVTQSAVRKPISRIARASVFTETNSDENIRYSEEAQIQHSRQKRAVTNLAGKTCDLYMKADPIYFTHVQTDTQDGSSKTEQQTRDEINAFFASSVAKLNDIYSTTQFVTGSDTYTGVHFTIKRTQIMTPTSAKCSTTSATEYCTAKLDVSYFLDLHSKDDYSEFCLAYALTARDFTKGTLGLAWVGSSGGSAGGICENHMKVQINDVTSMKSLNTGVVTVVNFGKPVAPTISYLSLAHEIGHNFGAQHDSTPECAPSGTNRADAKDGNYIMFPSSNNGEKANNVKFSSCSIQSMAKVLKKVIEDASKNCFVAVQGQFCGNGILETGEECDCGYEGDCTDTCCNPRGHADECKLKANRDCSPNSGACCNSTCQLVPASSNLLCRSKGECSEASHCDTGTSVNCPNPQKASDGVFCSGNSAVCKDGECKGSLCSKINWEDCLLTSGDYQMCYLACQKAGTSDCISSYDTTKVNANSDFKALLANLSGTGEASGIVLPAGSACDNYRGYCSEFKKCRTADSEGPLSRLFNLILSESTFATAVAWMEEYWWAVALMGLGLIAFMAALIKFCGRSTFDSFPYAKQRNEGHHLREMDDQRKRSRSPDKYRHDDRNKFDDRQRRYEGRERDDYRKDRHSKQERHSRDERHSREQRHSRDERQSREQRHSRGQDYNEKQRPSRTSQQNRHSREMDNSYNVDRRGPPPPYSAHPPRSSREHGYPGGYY